MEQRLPSGPAYPRALQTLGWIARPGPFMTQCQRRYGDVFTMRIRNEGTWVFLAHPDAVREVFTGDPSLLRAGEGNEILGPIVGQRSVLLLDEPEHMVERKLVLGPFHGERMQRYGELMDSAAREEVARWPIGEPFALWPAMQAVTLEVILRAVFGLTDTARLERMRELLRRMLAYTTSTPAMALVSAIGPKRLVRLPVFRRLMDPVDLALREEIRVAAADPALEERDDILAMLLAARYEDGSPMSETSIRDELLTLLVAGHETTATSLAWALERVLRHPAQHERLRAGEEEYVDAVVRETLRLRPVLPIVVRRLATDMTIAGHDLPAGVGVCPCIYLVHRRPEIYPEPLRFRPERFLEQTPGTYTWIPFGGGVRRCLGAAFALFEMRRVLTVVAREAELAAVGADEPVVRRAITLAPGRRSEALLHARAPVAVPA